MVSSNRPPFGTITVCRAAHAAMEQAGYTQVKTYCWTPPPAVRSDLPRNFTFELQCAHRPDGQGQRLLSC